MKSPVPPTTGWSEGLMLCVPPTMEIDPTCRFIRRVIFAIEMLWSPSRLDVMEVPSPIPTSFEDRLAVTVKGSWKTNKVPKGVVFWLTPGPATPFTMIYPVLLMVSCWKRVKWRDLRPWWWEPEVEVVLHRSSRKGRTTTTQWRREKSIAMVVLREGRRMMGSIYTQNLVD